MGSSLYAWLRFTAGSRLHRLVTGTAVSMAASSGVPEILKDSARDEMRNFIIDTFLAPPRGQTPFKRSRLLGGIVRISRGLLRFQCFFHWLRQGIHALDKRGHRP